MAENPTPSDLDKTNGGRPFVLGANHRSSSMLLRDRLFVEQDAMAGFLAKLEAVGIGQALVMSTCDRVEVQAFLEPWPTDDAAKAEIERRVLDVMSAHGETSLADMAGQTYADWDEAAVRQIFAVASSLDSLIIGEPQVLGQVKTAHRIARQCGMVGSGLETILQAAYATAKKVRSETAIGQRPVSIAAAATQIAGDLHGDLSKCSALLIGNGEMGELIAADMLASKLGRLTVIHPTERRAADIASRLTCNVGLFEDLGKHLADADIVLSSLGRRKRAVEADQVSAAVSARRHKPIFLIDTAIPGDIDPAVEKISDAFLYTMDDLERVAMEGRAGRESVSGSAWAIVERDVAAFLRGQTERGAVPAVSRLRDHVEAIREQALADAGGDAEKATRLLVKRLLHTPSGALRETTHSGDDEMMEQAIERLFGLDDTKGDES